MDHRLMRYLIALLLLITPAMGQSSEQTYRQIIAVLSQENVRLGNEVEALKAQLMALQAQHQEKPDAQHK